jgi:hypothetical protein
MSPDALTNRPSYQIITLLTLCLRSRLRSRAATERHETRSLSAGTINKREQFHKGNKDMDVLCSVREILLSGAASIGSSSVSLRKNRQAF